MFEKNFVSIQRKFYQYKIVLSPIFQTNPYWYSKSINKEWIACLSFTQKNVQFKLKFELQGNQPEETITKASVSNHKQTINL